MAWIILLASGLFETVWVVAMNDVANRPRLGTVALMAVAMIVSLAGLAYAMRSIPVGTAYAVWVGIGAVGTVVYGIAVLGDPASAVRLACIALIILGVVGLKFA